MGGDWDIQSGMAFRDFEGVGSRNSRFVVFATSSIDLISSLSDDNI